MILKFLQITDGGYIFCQVNISALNSHSLCGIILDKHHGNTVIRHFAVPVILVFQQLSALAQFIKRIQLIRACAHYRCGISSRMVCVCQISFHINDGIEGEA